MGSPSTWSALRLSVSLITSVVSSFASLGVALAEGPRVPALAPRNPVLERSPVERVIRQSAVDALYQDADGFLWLGTREGLVRWDGETARYWHSLPFDDTSLRHNMVVGIDQDRLGHLWVVTRVSIHGASQVSRLVAPAMQRFVHYPTESVVDLTLDPEGRPWLVGVETVYRYVHQEDRFEAWIEREARATELLESVIDRHGKLWVLDTGGLDRCQLTERTCETFAVDLPPRQRRLLAVDGDRIRLSSAYGVACFDFERERLGPCDDLGAHELGAGRLGSPVTAATRDATGELWLASFEGVWRMSPAGPRPVPIGVGSGAASDDVYNLFGDHSGGVWATTPWGLLYWDPHRQPFELLALNDGSSGARSSAPIMALHEDAAGTLWIGTIGDGLYALAPTGDWRHFPEDLWVTEPTKEASFVWSITSLGEDLWLATTYGLVRFDRQTGDSTRVPLPDPVNPRQLVTGVRRVQADPSGRLWVLTFFGTLYRFDPLSRFDSPSGGELFERVFHEPVVEIEDLALQGERTIWLATAEDGLRRLDPVTGEARAFRHDPADPRSLAGRGASTLRVDSRGDLWIGTTRGLDRLAEDGEHFVHVLGPHDLPSSAVLTILEGPRRFWLSTNRGLVSIDQEIARRDEVSAEERQAAVTVWDLDDGVGNLEFNRGAMLRDRKGRLLFGGDRGVTRFRPEAIEPSAYRPPIRLEGVTVVSRRGTRRLDLVPADLLEIGPEVTSFTVELGTIDFTSPSRNRFALQLVGIDPDRIELGTRRLATYAGVPPGRYTLHGWVSNADGVWSDERLEVALLVVPPFYRTALFRIGSVVVAAALVLGLGTLVSRRRYQRQLERLQAKSQREEDRRRISRDLHDDLGAGLTQIVLLSEKEKLRPSVGGEGLQTIADSARRLIDGIREIIWSIDPQHDRLDRLAARLRATAAEMLEAADLGAALDFPERPPQLTISPQLRRNLSLILREALHNAVRHAQARRVRVQFAHDDGELLLTVADDGRGFAVDQAAGGNGLRNLRDRAVAVGGATVIDSQPGDGTRVRVRLPLRTDSQS
ncbi:MAG: two-component regulator propeller domain-containing protein [Acidobacteriota bacterium]